MMQPGETLVPGEPCRIGAVVLLPVERARLAGGALGGGRWIYASKEPVAVVVDDAGGVRALDLAGRILSLPVLCQRVEGLAEALAAVRDAASQARP